MQIHDRINNHPRLFMLIFFVINVLLVISVATPQSKNEDMHDVLFSESRFPSATLCQTCHPKHYEEWSVSAHAYAQLSPVFNAMQAKITKITNGTNGDFCSRCHTQVGMSLGEPTFISNLERHPTSREGVTCITCHRRKNGFGKVSGRIALVEGDLFEPVYGSMGNAELKRIQQNSDYHVNTERGQEGRAIHVEAKQLDQITTSAFCSSCHDVNHVDGFRLEEAFSEYKSSPAAKRGVSCQDCHMGLEPGVPSGYANEPVAIIGGKPTKPRKRTNHMFAGPDYSIVHPGIFPHNPTAQEYATMQEWLDFDYKAGWGTDNFEDNVLDNFEFPERWESAVDRYDARDILNDNLELLKKIDIERKKLLRFGYQLGEVVVEKVASDGIKFKVEIRNGTDGHNVPTGFDAERLVFLQVSVVDKDGNIVFESGDLDPNGDVRDSHSMYVHRGELPKDKYLFSLQSKFLVKMIRGGEREQILPINYSPSSLPFIRPSTQSTLLLGRPTYARKHRRTIHPLGSKWANYEINKAQLSGSDGPYKANIKIISGMVPVNLVYEIQDVGFDYGMSAREVADAVVDGHTILWEREIVLQTGAIEHHPNQIADVKKEKNIIYGAETVSKNGEHSAHNSFLNEAIPLQIKGFPRRPRPLLEIGDPFLDNSKIKHGFGLPTGAIWQPSFLAWGTYRTALQTFYVDNGQVSEWANRFDLFGNMYFTPTERILIGFRPFDQNGRFTGYTLDAPDRIRNNNHFNDEFNFDLNTLFFEGDFGELFPFLDKHDKKGLDFGLSVGRQQISFQEGMLIHDNVDAFGITKINLKPKGMVNLRSTFIWGWNELNRTNLFRDDKSSSFYGWFNEMDWRRSTVNADIIYVDANDFAGDGIYAGLSSTQRLDRYNTSFRVLGSLPIGNETIHNSPGLLIFSEISWTPRGNHNYFYVNSFWGIDRFRSASRDPLAGGPLSKAGVLFEAVGVGSYGAALNNLPDNAFGGAIGYQMFFNHTRRQLLLEFGGRYGTNDFTQRALAFGASYQAAFGRRGVIRLDGFALFDKSLELTSNLRRHDFQRGGRLEFLYKF